MRTRVWKTLFVLACSCALFAAPGCKTDGVGERGTYNTPGEDSGSNGGEDAGVGDAAPGGDGGGIVDAAADGTSATDGGGTADGSNTTDGSTAGDAGGDGGRADAAPTPCRSDDDCSGSQVCAVDRSGNMVKLLCRAPNSMGGGVGDSCSKDADCASNLCRNGSCTKPCSRPIQCSMDGSWTCKEATVTAQGGGTKKVNICQPAPAKMCITDGDCAGNDQCVARKKPSAVEFLCDSPNQGGGQLGDTCSKDADCAKNLCVDGTCTKSCAGDTDCSSAANHVCKTTSVDLGNGNTASASICVSRQPCDETDECKVGEYCYVQRDRTSSAGVCRQPNPGGGSLGDVCQKDAHCSANLCYDARFRKICSLPCKDATDCPTAGFRCKDRMVADGQGGTNQKKICVPAEPVACKKQSKCGPNEHCAVVVEADGSGLESVCIPDPGGVAVGSACTKDADCKSQICLAGTCSSPCTDRSQCANNQVCRNNAVTKSGQTATFQVCETLPPEKCTSTGTCSDPIRVCSSLRTTGGTDDAYCQFPNSSATGQLGDSCSKDRDCKSGLCLGGGGSSFIGECSAACTSNTQCGTNQMCANYGGNPISTCQKPCTTNANCSGTNICALNEDPNTSPNTLDTVCRKRNTSGKQFGGTCPSQDGSKCESGLCLTVYAFEPSDPRYKPCTRGAGQCASGWGCYPDPNQGNATYCADLESRCTRLCSSNADCTGGTTSNTFHSCDNSINYRLNDGGTTQISACSR